MSRPRNVLLTRPVRERSVGRIPLQKESPGEPTPHPPPPKGEGWGGGSPQGTDNKINELLSGVASLSQADRQELLARLSLSIKAPESSRDAELWATAVHEAFVDALGGAVGASAAPMVIRKVVATREALAPILGFMSRAKLDKKTPAERLAIYRSLAELLMAYVRRISRHTQAPLTPKFFAGQQDKIAAVFDAAFPGYLAAGLAGVVAGRIIAGVRYKDE